MDTKDRKRSPRPAAGKASPAATKPVRRRSTTRQRASAPEVVYTPPKAFNKHAFLLRLVTVVAVVLALTLGMAIFFKVENIAVSGMSKYTAWDIRQASGIQEGENLLSLNKAMVSGKITTNLPYVESVRIGIKLPDTVNIEITEMDVAYAVEASDGSWWLMNANGKLVEKITAVDALSYTRILGVELASPQAGQQAAAAEATEPETSEPVDTEEGQSEEPTEETVVVAAPVTVLGSERLEAAVSILQYLESNGIVGGVTSVDVSSITALEMWYEDRYQVYLGDTTQLDRKINAMKEAISQMTDYDSGELDVSFTNWPDMVGYDPFVDEDT